MSSGIERIAAERQRQIEQEGWKPEHDDQHSRGELAEAAVCYADFAANQAMGNPTSSIDPLGWPFESESLKVSDDPIRNLEKAGALIAAEIDRLLRARNKTISIVERRAN